LKRSTDVAFTRTGESREARELETRINRVSELEKMERGVTLQLQLMNKGRARRIHLKDEDRDEDSVPVYKWKPQRLK
jgi:Utp11 protein